MMPPPSLNSLRDLARTWAALGLSVVPIKPDGSKGPAIRTWTELQQRILTEEEIDQHFKPGIGIGIIAGEVSGNLEILDFDVPMDKESGEVFGDCLFDAWLDCLNIDLFELVTSMPTIRTPYGGRHLYYRCEGLEGNKKLALVPNPKPPPPTLTVIETRGRGGYVLAPGCPPECHPSGNTYELLSGSLEGIPTITTEQRAALFAVARSFDESDLSQKEARRRDPGLPAAASRDGMRPGDDYNRRAQWADILEPQGWTFAYHRRHDGASCWKRPGKGDREKGISATVREFDGLEIFHSFSSNSDPLPHDESITKFTAYTLFEHNGDYAAAARELGKQGFGEPPRHIADLDTLVDGRRDDSVPWNDEPPGYKEARVTGPSSGEEESPPDIPFDEGGLPPFDASIFHEVVDPLEVQLHEDEEKLEVEEKHRKRQERLKRRQVEMSKGTAYLVWRDFGEPPRRDMTKDGRIKTRVDRPRDTAWIILQDIYSSGDGVRRLHYQSEQFMVWNGERYRSQKGDDVRPRVSRYLSHFAEFKCEDEDGKFIYEPFKIRNVRTIEMIRTIQDMVHIDSDILDPCWLCDTKDDEELPDPREIVCCKNGLLDIQTRELLPPTPAFYSFNNTGIVYDPQAEEPKAWLEFLKSSVDEESQLLLQQWFGYCLVQDTRLHKMLMVVGKSGSGKGTAMAVLRRLVGESACCAMTFDKFDMNFGLQNALGKSLMIFPDARQNAKFDIKGSAVGAILTITGEDEMQIDRKNRDPITRKLNTRLVVVSNDVMQLTDRSKALSRRMLWIKFPGHENKVDPNLKAKLFEELSGILNWAIEGWAMVQSTGGFVQPKSANMLRAAFEEQSSDIASFIDDMCVTGEDKVVEKVDLVNHWNAWRISKGYRKMGEAVFGKLLSSAVMQLDAARKRIGGIRKNFYLGIGLDPEKVTDYAEEYGGTEVWKDLLRTMTRGTREAGGADVVTIQEYLDSKTKKD